MQDTHRDTGQKHIKIEARRLNSYDNFFLVEKESIKHLLASKQWTKIHRFTYQGNALTDPNHVPVEEVYKIIDECEKVGISLDQTAREGHQLTCYMGLSRSYVFYICKITKDDLTIHENK